MIRYNLRCDQDHRFDSWFQSADAFDKLLKRGLVTCAVCGSVSVEKAVMAPRLNTADAPRTPLSAPKSPAEQAVAAMRDHIEKNSEYVGTNFVKEARAIHDGETQERSIWGEARPEDARKLVEDGVKIAPLPFLPTRKSN